jgi:class 3 adenylate cyclase
MSEHLNPGSQYTHEAARPIGSSVNTLPDPHRWQRATPADPSPASLRRPSGSASSPAAEALFGPLTLSPEQINAPALFVDTDLSIRWIAPGSKDRFSRVLVQQLKSASTRNVFNLLLRPAVKHALTDWRTFFSFVYTTLHPLSASTGLDIETQVVTKDHVGLFSGEAASMADGHAFLVNSCLIGEKEASGIEPMRVFSLKFKQGTLFLFRRDHWQNDSPTDIEAESTAYATQPMSGEKTICVLSARLNDAHRMAESMLPKQFFKLMNRIWDEADEIVRSLGGQRSACSGGQLCYLFKENAGRHPVFSAVCSATRLNDRMSLLEEKLKAQDGWSVDICLNMGIAHGVDDQLDDDPCRSMEFVIPGGAFDQSACLAGIAEKGEIWVTKNAVTHLPKKLIRQVVLGVDQQGKFIRNFFARLADLKRAGTDGHPYPVAGMQSVARILHLDQNQNPSSGGKR